MILVTGGSGVMGSRVVRGLLDRGARVRALVLPGDPCNARLDGLGCDVREGDVGDARSLEGAFDGVRTVFHLAAVILSRDPAVFERVNVQGTQNAVGAAAAAGAKHFVYVSSASVTYSKRTPYADSKLRAEEIVTGQGDMAFTVVRPTLVYDVGGGQEFVMFYDYLTRFPVVPFIGEGRALKRPVWVEDVVRGLVAIADNPVTHGRTYNLSGPEAIPIIDMARMMLEHRGRRPRFLRLPVSLCRAAAVALGAVSKAPPLTLSAIAGVTEDADLDCSAAGRDLGFRPLGFREGLRRCFPV